MERVVAVILESIIQTLEQGARVELRGFGAFSTRHRQARKGRNPRTGGTVPVPEKHVPFFRAGKDLKARIDASKDG
jgi:integration host factor subunit beta